MQSEKCKVESEKLWSISVAYGSEILIFIFIKILFELREKSYLHFSLSTFHFPLKNRLSPERQPRFIIYLFSIRSTQ